MNLISTLMPREEVASPLLTPEFVRQYAADYASFPVTFEVRDQTFANQTTNEEVNEEDHTDEEDYADEDNEEDYADEDNEEPSDTDIIDILYARFNEVFGYSPQDNQEILNWVMDSELFNAPEPEHEPEPNPVVNLDARGWDMEPVDNRDNQ